jgi:hypothetical protein
MMSQLARAPALPPMQCLSFERDQSWLHRCCSGKRAHPSEAKALCFKAISGMAEAVPFQNAIYAAAQ